MDTCTVVVDMTDKERNKGKKCVNSFRLKSLNVFFANSRVELHVTGHKHSLFTFVNLLDTLLEVRPYLLQVDVLQPAVAAEVWSRHCSVQFLFATSSKFRVNFVFTVFCLFFYTC